MPIYAYRCKVCGSEYESQTPADAAECWTEDCPGPAHRVWTTALLRENLRQAR